MATAQDIIDRAYNKLGIKTPTADQNTDALDSLNDMISSWSADSLVVPYRTLENFTLTVGSATYTIGSAGNFNTVRPLEIMEIYIRDSSNNDHYLTPMTQAQYAAIVNKLSDARPERYYYDPQYSLGKIYFESEPTTAETIYIISEKSITELAALTTTVSLPDFYKEAFVYNLAVRLALDSNIALLPNVTDIAVMSKNTIENMVSKDKLMRTSKMDNALLIQRNKNSFNINNG